MAFEGEVLQRVLVLPEAGNTGAVKLLAAELYDDGVIIRWMRRPSAPAIELGTDDPVLTPGSGVRITDTAGTEYQLASMSASASAGSFHGQTVFTPAVPPDARALSVSWADHALVEADVHPQRS